MLTFALLSGAELLNDNHAIDAQAKVAALFIEIFTLLISMMWIFP